MPSNASVPTHHASCLASTMPLLAGFCGGIIGAALMFLVMTACVSPKVEIREVVRYVPQEASLDKVAANLRAAEEIQPEIKPDEPKQAVPLPPKVKSQAPPQALRELPWFLAMLKPLTCMEAHVTVVMNGTCDLDAMLERRAELARQAQRFEPRPQLIQYNRSNDPPSNFSPLMYRGQGLGDRDQGSGIGLDLMLEL